MVNKAAHPGEINDLATWRRSPERTRPTRYNKGTRWPKPLHDQILTEANLRGWSFSRMVRHLCEASIEGIE